MPRRLFYVTFGAVAGVLAVRQAAKAAAAMAPGSVAGSLVASVQEFVADVRAFMAEREDEIREALGLYEADEDEPSAELRAAVSEDTVRLERLRQR
ncbi:hypothetical protein I6A60_14435 [Frankia sp. AgB1.9]|uniref:hypothetical protein n=1 Tax=unclassified Frankia TaxID=2632575 RepID=UPI0019321C02|nr:MULTISPECIES: hypothetical protein [unclassified Frankia]MBL7493192.1 hypothetical protein [Frankia sp. AgW1.1]MBL7549070.1 hypothetical protein [Frankia sp. AgB1.9]MBL7624285.1 hypothetical protein [Frankia sp. AgB1.8]